MKRGLTSLRVRGAVALCLVLTSGCDDIQPGRARAPARTVHETQEVGALTDSTGKPLSALARRIVATNGAADRDMNLVARVEVQPGELLELYEIAPGRIMLSGAGAPAAAPLFGDAPKEMPRSAPELAELWSVVAGAAAMPAALSRAIARVGLRRANQLARQVPLSVADSREVSVVRAPAHDFRAPAAPMPADGTEIRQSAIVGGWCQTSYYTAGIAGYFGRQPLGFCPSSTFNTATCWNNVTGDAAVSHGDAGTLLSNVCPYRGQVTFKVEADESWIQKGSWTVAEDTYRWQYTEDDGCDVNPFNDCPWIRTSVVGASGDGYNYRFLARDP